MRALPACLLLVATLFLPGAAPAGPAASAKAKAPARSAPATARAAAPAARPARRPLTLAAQNIEGRAEAPRVLFVHTGPTIALEDAPRHPSYLRDDFTAALSSPVTVHVRNLSPLAVPTTPGGNR